MTVNADQDAYTPCVVMLQGDVKKVTDDVAALKPSIFAAVPRVLDRMKSGIEAKIKKLAGSRAFSGWLTT